MRRLTFAFFAFCLVLAPLASSVAQESGPTAVLPEPIKNFDIVPRGDVLHHTFVVKNEGSGMLELTDVRPACGCTVADFDREIPPGESGAVKVKLETATFTGPISKPIAIFTNDPANPKMQVVVKADVKPYLGVSPGYARFIYVQGENLKPISQVLWAEDGSDLEILDVKTPYDHVKVEYREAKEDEKNSDYSGKQWVLDVHLEPYAPVGALREYAEVIVDHAQQKSVRLPLSGFVRPRQHVTPPKIDFGVVDGSTLPLTRVVSFTNFITDGIEVKQADSGVDGLSVEVKEVGEMDGHRFELHLTVGPEVPKGEFQSQLQLHITDDQQPVVVVPMKGKVL